MIDTKQIAERVKEIRHEQEHYFPDQPNEPTEVELCGYVEHLLSERKEMLREIYDAHLAILRPKTEDSCVCTYCTEHRELTTAVGDTDADQA